VPSFALYFCFGLRVCLGGQMGLQTLFRAGNPGLGLKTRFWAKNTPIKADGQPAGVTEANLHRFTVDFLCKFAR
jgi:hypothetical protein